MSTKTVTRKQSRKPARNRNLDHAAPAPAAVDRTLAVRRARTALLLGPTLDALREYRRASVEELDRSIKLLEDLEGWTAGGPMPSGITRFAAISPLIYEHKGPDTDETVAAQRELFTTYVGPIELCEVATDQLARHALGWDPMPMQQSAMALREALRESQSVDVTVEALFDRRMLENGIDIWEGEKTGRRAEVARA